MKKSKFFGANIEPACEYCEHGKRTKDYQMVLCKYKGAVAPYFSCRKFLYSPLLRIPKPQKALKKYNKEDFQL